MAKKLTAASTQKNLLVLKVYLSRNNVAYSIELNTGFPNMPTGQISDNLALL